VGQKNKGKNGKAIINCIPIGGRRELMINRGSGVEAWRRWEANLGLRRSPTELGKVKAGPKPCLRGTSVMDTEARFCYKFH
jgi:hypothetical protein